MYTKIYEEHLDKNEANYQPLSPIGFLERAAKIYPDHTAIVHGNQTFTYDEFYARARKLASALAKRYIGRGDTVAVLLPNVPAMFEAHFGVPMVGAVLNTINMRLDAATVAYILDHGEAKILIVDTEFGELAKEAVSDLASPPRIIVVDDIDL